MLVFCVVRSTNNGFSYCDTKQQQQLQFALYSCGSLWVFLKRKPNMYQNKLSLSRPTRLAKYMQCGVSS